VNRDGQGRGAERGDTVYTPGPAPRPRRPSSPYGLLLALAGCGYVALGAAAEYVAWAFAFHPNLGPPAFVVPPSAAGPLLFGAGGVAAGVVGALALSLAVPWVRVVRPLAPVLLLACALAAVLGRSLLGGEPVPIYSPFRFLGWGLAYGGFQDGSPYAGVFTRGVLVFGGAFAAAAVALLAARRAPGRLVSTGSHGTAAWSDGAELVAHGKGNRGPDRRKDRGKLAEEPLPGVLVGRRLTDEGRQAPKRLNAHERSFLRYAGEGHLVTVAPTRSGKGTGAIIPNLLTYPGSVVVTDPKGENYAVTARRRARAFGQAVRALDPFDQLGALAEGLEATGRTPLEVVRATYNPMDLIDPEGDDGLEAAALLADMLVLPPEGRGGEEAFWNEEAKALLAGLVLYVAAAELDEHCRPTARRTLGRVRELLTLPRPDFDAVLEAMLASDLYGGLVRRAAARHLQKEDRERSGVVSTAQSHTHFLDSPRMTEAMARSSLDLRRLKTEGVSLYLVLPAHHLDTYARWLRLVVACAFHELARVPGRPVANGRPHRVLFLLDEFAHLGRMNPVLRAFGLMAGFGVQVWAFLQDLSQLKGTYPDRWGTFLANADVLQAFGTNDLETARYLSELTGEATVFASSASENLSRSRGKHASRSEGAGASFSEKGRRLLTPDEVRRLPPGEQLLFVKGTRPIRARKADYLTDPAFRPAGRPLFDDNPMHVAGVARPVEPRRSPVPGASRGDEVEAGRGASDQDWTLSDDDVPAWMRG
jgi:type IV secretion system protein VirD4